jgi:hypothetical protein
LKASSHVARQNKYEKSYDKIVAFLKPSCDILEVPEIFLALKFQFFNCDMPSDDVLRERFFSVFNPDMFCLFGDSQSRSVYNEIVRILEPDNVKCFSVGKFDKYQCVPKRARIQYSWNMFANADFFNLTKNCSAFTFNTGQWPLSYVSNKKTPTTNKIRPYTDSEYLLLLDDLHEKVQQVPASKKAFWLATNIFSHSNSVIQNNDWRTLLPLRHRERMAHTYWTHRQMPIIEPREITDPLFDLSYDTSHYRAPVERMRARFVLQYVLTSM